MHKHLLPLAALLAATPALPQASANVAAGRAQPSPLAPAEIVNAAPKGDWAAIASSDLLVMDLAPDAKGKPRRVVIQLMPAPFSQGWVSNIRKLAAARFWDGTSINRVQDNYVVQWGDANAEDKAKARKLPVDLALVPENNYSARLGAGINFNSLLQNVRSMSGFEKALPELTEVDSKEFGEQLKARLAANSDPYSKTNRTMSGWPVGVDYEAGTFWPVHCYGMVGVGRDMPPNTGTGAELYTVIGHAPRHLDRNIALVGRVIEGIEHMSSLPRGKGALGFYDLKQGDKRVGIRSVRIGSEVKGLGGYEYLSTESESFTRYADARANRRDAFFIRPAGGADVCNIPVPVRRVR